mmetsp:Transcript_13989/g.20893  ORF Transcript_13989/g.20893 Transcript_13989/m.20893 type:complete len:238 (-) Transcript_13989:47-760(-)
MSSLLAYLTSFADDQRLERLRQCLEIEEALFECERIRIKVAATTTQTQPSSGRLGLRWGKRETNNDDLTVTDTDTSSLNDGDSSNSPRAKLNLTRAGMKMSRFYDWNLSNPRAQEAIHNMRSDGGFTSMLNLNDTLEGRKKFDDNVETSTCSREKHAIWGCRAMSVGCAKELVTLKKCFQNDLGTTNPQHFAYDRQEVSSDPDSKIDECRLDMRNLGDCVTKNMEDLRLRKINLKRS